MLDTVQRVHTLFSRPFYPIGVMSALRSETGLPVVSHECMMQQVCRLLVMSVWLDGFAGCMMQQICQLLVMSA